MSCNENNKILYQLVCKHPTFLAKCLKSSVEMILPALQSGFLKGFRHNTIYEDILLLNWSFIFLAVSLDVSAAAVVVFLPLPYDETRLFLSAAKWKITPSLLT